jgi:hypothetical protein
MRNAAFFLVLLVVLAVGCSPSTPVRTEPSGGSTPAAPATPAETPVAFVGTLDAVEVKRPEAPPVVVLRDVRTASQVGFDRIVFEFEESAVPGYRVEYVDPPAIQCGSGEPVEVAGAALLQVRLVPAQAHTEAGEATVGERERRPNLPVLQELESTCDFEADVTWVLGLAARNRFRVQELPGPARLVIDIQHGRP